MASLRQRTDQVVADKKLMKAMTTYAEEKRDMLAVTIFDGKAELTTSPGIAKLLEKETHLDSFRELVHHSNHNSTSWKLQE